MTVNGNTRSMRQHIQRSLGDDFVEPPASVMSAMPNDDNEDDEGEEFQPKAASRGGRATTTPGRGRGRPSRTGRKTSGTVNQTDEDEMETSSVTMSIGNNTTYVGAAQSEEKGYFHHLLAGKTNIQVLVDQWIDSYQANRDEALIELMQFFLDSSGCKGKLTQTMYLKMEHVDMLRAMTEHFDEDTSEYPIIMSGLQYKKFRSSFSEFVVLLIKQASYSIIYDQYMIDNLVTLLTALSDSPVRAFRHTGTLAVLKVMTALVDIALTISIQKDQCQRQYEAERQKSSARRAADRLDTLTTKRKELEGNENEIKSFMNFIFKGVFIHRYRDIVPDIRCLCMSELGEWMKSYPMVFLDDIYLKYIGWTLYDKVGDCRLRCLLALIPLFQTTDLVGKLELFTNRFKDRIVQMTVDCEYEVAVQAIKLLTAILKFNERILEDKDCENIYELVYHSHRQVAQAAGEFLNQKLFHKAEQPSNSSKKRSQNTAFIHLLVQFFIESELHEHATYLVDSMWDQHPMMKDWECMTDILLEAPDQEEDPLDDQHENCLIEIMVCCVREAATGEYPIGRGQPNRKLTMKEQKQKEDDKKVLTDHFIGTLPPLLNKYIADADKLLNLLQIPLHFNYEVYTTTRRERDLDAYLNALSDIVQRHTTAEIFDAVSKCFECVCDVSFTLSNRAIAHRGNIIDKILANFNAAMGIFEEMDEADEDDLYPLLLNLRKLDAFHQCHDLGNTDLWDKIHLLFKAAIDNEDMSPEIVDKCFGIANRSLLWGLYQLDMQFDKDLLKKLVKRSRKLCALCQKLMLHANTQICHYAYSTLCDLLISMSPHLVDKNSDYQVLAIEINENLIQALLTFLNTYVFFAEEPKNQDEQAKIETLHKKRNLLAAYCKLIVHNVLPIQAATNILKYYVKFSNDFGDIIKNTFTRARDISKIHTAKTMAYSLMAVYKDCVAARDAAQEAAGNDETINIDLSPLRELARRFNLSFGLDMAKQREALAALHRECIRFALTPLFRHDDSSQPGPNLLFLEVLPEFASKLLKPDKKAIYDHVDKLVHNATIEGDAWQPLINYRRILNDEPGGGHGPKTRASTATRGRKRAAPQDDDNSRL
ncbi:unnamed protein product [Rotaria magnacalcarata]|uniref:SCD domain-containing protein n=14 Tax=Rotaria TaxID=231623 RepID=A0A816KIT4_9BILA|nr:unnamed protein product [Rotaria magnacalcarata]CAF1612348.1 unnamed protein product [Rotaria magnacalcarata]CAF1926857.1 unnamed protein product [Rotaria magnacalcarata]CAF2161785.1 unnamed protein product [Rotaria magnacalcarata]CAF3967238.1 unnamed protein product [Rotaria magnacalcarata]